MKAIKFFMTLILVSSMVFAAEAGTIGLKIIPPKSDGGSPLVKYFIQKMDVKEGRWERAGEVPASMIEKGGVFVYAEIGYPVRDLEEGKTYRFRVIAVNPYGEGDPGRPSEDILVVKEDIGYFTVICGEGLPSRRNMSFSALSDAPFAKQALEREMVYRKEELLANLLNKSV